MRILGLLLLIVTNTLAQQMDAPDDLERENILIELNSFERTVELLSLEFERSNDKEKCEQRKKAILETKISNNRIEIGDPYGVAIPYNIVEWMNETIVKSLTKAKTKQYTVLDEKTIENFPADKWRYVLRYKYLMKGGDPLETRLIFYFFDRKENKDLINYETLENVSVFRPVMYFTAESMYPFYNMIRIFNVKKDLEAFFKAL